MDTLPIAQEKIMMNPRILARNAAKKILRAPIADSPPLAPKIDEKLLDQVTAKLNRLFDINGRRLDYSIHSRTNRLVVRIIEGESGSVIREMPSERFLELVSNLEELLGLVFDAAV